MQRQSAYAVALFLLGTWTIACGSDKDGSGAVTGTGGTSAGKGGSGGSASAGSGGTGAGMCKTTNIPTSTMSNSDACKAFCAMEDGCKASTTIADCLGYHACDAQDSGSSECVAANKRYWECLLAQTDALCMAEDCCTAQSDAAFEACPGE